MASSTNVKQKSHHSTGPPQFSVGFGSSMTPFPARQ
jgi:hypothetical protein